MDVIDKINAEVERGFYKKELEQIIGLPKNSLSGLVSGKRRLSKKTRLKIELYFSQSTLPSPTCAFLQSPREQVKNKQPKIIPTDSVGFVSDPETKSEKSISQIEADVLLQEIRSRKIPKERDTVMGRPVWKKEIENEIQEVQNKIQQ